MILVSNHSRCRFQIWTHELNHWLPCAIYQSQNANILLNGCHLKKKKFFWHNGVLKRAIPKEYECQFWCLYLQMNDYYCPATTDT